MIEGIISSILATGITTGFKYREQIYKRLLWNVFNPKQKIRISVASLIRIKTNDKYLIIKNLNRPESFSPIGGVIKYSSTAKTFLNSIQWEDEAHKNSAHKKKLQRDLRGFIESKNLFKFLKWYLSGNDREGNSLHREIKEELQEINLSGILSELNSPQFNQVRVISEGLNSVEGKNFKQFRILSIYEFSGDNKTDEKFSEELIKAVDTNENLLLVSSDEISQGRAHSGEVIGSNSEYLFRNKKNRNEDSSWSSKK